MTKYFSVPLLIVVSLAFNQHTAAQSTKREIDLDIQDKTLEEVFQELITGYDLSLSYMNNDLPIDPISIKVEKESVDHVLTELLKNTELEYIKHGSQIIVKRQAPEPEPAQQLAVLPVNRDSLITAADTAGPSLEPVDTVGVTVAIENKTDQSQDSLIILEDTLSTSAAKPNLVEELDIADSAQELTELDTVSQQIQPVSQPLDSGIQKRTRIGHAGLFYPLSSNGVNANEYINNFSLHLISGYSGGLNGLEVSSVANVVKGDVNGLQLTGVSNVVKGFASGIQISGAANLVEGNVTGIQVAGATNIAKADHLGVQLAGAANVVTGSTGGFQGSLGVNYAKGSVLFGQVGSFNFAHQTSGPQLAGFMNIQKKKGQANGVQIAGFMNTAGKLNGFQIAGFMNQAEKVNGAQVAGFLNTAGTVNGAQIGLINIADSLTGAPIGLFSLVKKNGYYDLELFYADDFQANAIIKIGAPAFHNLFGFSYEMDYKKRWAYGYGFGSQIGRNAFRLNLDAMAYHVIEQEFPNGVFKDYQLNLLSKFRMLASLHHNNFGIFAGPVFNVMVSRVVNPETEKVGSDIVSNPIYDNTDRHGNNVKMWLGYNVGIRF